MALSEFEKKRVEKLLTAYCENRTPPDLHDQIQLEFTILGNEVILFENYLPRISDRLIFMCKTKGFAGW
jgi:hypothetical protein